MSNDWACALPCTNSKQPSAKHITSRYFPIFESPPQSWAANTAVPNSAPGNLAQALAKGHTHPAACRRKMRMSGLSKVEMSGFMGARRSHGNGAHRLESTRTGPAESVTRGKAETDHTDRSCRAAEDHRSSGASPAAPSAGAGRPGADSRITWTALEPQVGSRVRAEDSGAGAPTLCGLRAHPGRRTLGPGGVAGEPRDAAEVDDQGQLVAPALPAREDYPCVA